MNRVFFLILLLTHLSQAGSLSPVKVKCPVCTTEFEGYVYHSSTSFGADRDFLPRSSSPFYRTLVTCPKCSLSHFTEHLVEMAPSLDQTAKDAWEKKYPVPFTDEPDYVDKMRLLIMFESLRNSPHLTKAYINLQAAWVVRLTHNPFAEKFEEIGYKRVQSLLEGIPSESRNSLSTARDLTAVLPQRTGEERAEIAIVVAYLYCDAGEFHELLAQPDLPHNGVEKVQEEEGEFQQQAVIEMQKALGGAEKAEAADLTYLIGELNRRLGNKSEAQTWLHNAVDHPSADADLRSWAEEQLQECDRLSAAATTGNSRKLESEKGDAILPTLLLAGAFILWGIRRKARAISS